MDIDNYVLKIDKTTHEAITKWAGAAPWNDQIMNRLYSAEAEAKEMLTIREVLSIGAEMRRGVKLQKVKISRYEKP